MEKKLLISGYLPSIIEMVQTYAISMITAPTGTGKSLGIPAGFAALGYRVFVSVPNITSVMSLFHSSQALYPQHRIGYANHHQGYYDDQSQIVYASSAYIRKLILSKFQKGKARSWDFSNLLILDEFHSGSIDNFLIKSLWKYGYSQRTDNSRLQLPNLLMMSATMVVDKSVAVLNVPERSYHIDLVYMNRNYSPHDKKLYSDTADLIKKHHQSNLSGHILVFVSGKGEVHRVLSHLSEIKDALILPTYSGIQPGDFQKIYQNTTQRKIIIATNIVETSVTIQGIALVIDTMFEKIIETSPSGGQRLVEKNIPKSSADQRKGRTGRTSDGICIRMMKKKTYDYLPDHRPDEITRLPLYHPLIELVTVGISPDKIMTPDKVPKEKLLSSIYKLQKLNNIDTNYQITDIGYFSVDYPLSIENSTALWYWIYSGYDIYTGVVLFSIIDTYGPSYVWIPPYSEKEELTYLSYLQKLSEHRKNYFDKYLGNSELETTINIWNGMMKDKSLYDPRIKQHVAKYSNRNSLNNKKMYELVKVIRNILSLIGRADFYLDLENQDNYTIDSSQTISQVRPILRLVYPSFDYSDRKAWSLYLEQGTNFEYSLDRNKLNTYEEMIPPKIIVLSKFERQKRNQTIRYITFGLDIPEDQLENTQIALNPQMEYVFKHPRPNKGLNYPEEPVYEMRQPLPDYDVASVLDDPVSLQDPNYQKYLLTDSISVLQI